MASIWSADPGGMEAENGSRQPSNFVAAFGNSARPVVRGKFIYTGNEKLLIKGVSYGAFAPDSQKREYWDTAKIERDFALMAANGVNTVRIPHTMPPVSLLDAAQRHGLWVMVGLSAEQYVGFLIDEDKQGPDVAKLIREKVRTVAGHPSLLCYGLGNEIAAPVARWLGRARVEQYLESLYRAVKAEDPGGIVTYVNYPSVEYLELPFLDFVSFNVYLEAPDRLRAYLARLQNIAGDRPLLMSEVGLDAMRNGEAKQAEVLRWQIEKSFAAGCAGVVIFSWTDEWHRAGAEVDDWAFGITDRERNPKPSLATVREAFQHAPFEVRTDWPKISVVICSYNGEKTIAESLEGTQRLIYPNFEVVVVNDGSTDSTAEVAERFPCRLITTENHGLSHARNVGAEHAIGEIVAYLDDDAIPDVHWLQHLANAFLETKHAAIGGPNVAPLGACAVAQCVDNAPGGPTHVLLDDETAEHLPGCNMAVRKSCLEAVGGFDPTFRVAGDDVDFCWRLQQRGWTLGFAPGAVVWHHRRSAVSAFWRQQKGYGKAEALLEKKWPEKFNSVGHHTFGGRVYGRGVVHALFRRCVVYHGAGGFAPFQSLYERAPGLIATLPLMPEWYLLVGALVIIYALGMVWAPLLVALPFLVFALVATLAHAVIGARKAIFSPITGSRIEEVKLRVLTGALYLAQPLARLNGRLGAGLTAWRDRGTAGFVFPRAQATAVWSEDWQEPQLRLEAFSTALRREKNALRYGGDYDDWDVEVIAGMFGAAQMLMAVEDHGAGTQYIRVRITPRYRTAVQVITSLFAVISVFALWHHQWLVLAVFSIPALLIGIAAFRQAGRATAALLRALQTLEGPTNIEKTITPARLVEPVMKL